MSTAPKKKKQVRKSIGKKSLKQTTPVIPSSKSKEIKEKNDCDFSTKWEIKDFLTEEKQIMRVIRSSDKSEDAKDYIMKKRVRVRQKDFNNDVYLQRKAASKGLAPKILDTYFCLDDSDTEGDGFIVMEKFDGDLSSLFREESDDWTPGDILREVVRMYFELLELGIQYPDIHIANVLYRREEGREIPKLVFTDFENAEEEGDEPNFWFLKTYFPDFIYEISIQVSKW